MGIQYSGVFGGFYNKTGPLVGRRSKGKNIITGLHHKSHKAATALQAAEREKFGILMAFLGNINNLVGTGFKNYTKRRSALNAAFTYNYQRALMPAVNTAMPGAAVINYAKVVYSRGHAAIPNCARAINSGPGNILFSWLPENQDTYCLFTDMATFVVYNPQKNQFITAMDAVSRNALSYALQIPLSFAGDSVYCYMNFNAKNGRLTGNSICIGTVLC